MTEKDIHEMTKKYWDIINKVVEGYEIDESKMNNILTDVIFCFKKGPNAPPVTHEIAHIIIPIINFIYDYENIPSIGIFQNVDEVTKTKELLKKDGIEITESEKLGIVSAEFNYKDRKVHSRFTDIASYDDSMLYRNSLVISQKKE